MSYRAFSAVAKLRNSNYSRLLNVTRVHGEASWSRNAPCRALSTNTTTVYPDILASPLGDLDIPESPILAQFVMDKWNKCGEKPAMICSESGDTISYNQLEIRVQKVASALVRLGYSKGDVVSIGLPNCPEFVDVYIGALCMGMSVSALNPASSIDELVYEINLSGSSLLVTTPLLLMANHDMTVKCPELKQIICTGQLYGYMPHSHLLEDDGEAFQQLASPDARNDAVVLPFSSGTTGMPKAVMLSSYNIVANLLQLGSPETLAMSGDDVYLCVLPMFHVFGQVVVMLLALRLGATMVLMPRFDPIKYLDNIKKYKPTYLHIVPPMLTYLAKHPLVPQYDLGSVRQVFYAAAPASPHVIEEAKSKVHANTVFCQGYGLTEASPGLSSGPQGRVRSHTAGIPFHNTHIQIRDAETGVPLGPGEQGEICARGPQIMMGYYKNQTATNNAIVDDWLLTGDMGYYDDDGYITVTDRLKELIKYNSYQVAPAELENMLLSHPAVQDAAVIGVPDEAAGELPRAYVVLRAGTSARQHDIASYINGQVSPWKQLRGGVKFIDEIPKAASGKILRRLLKEDALKR